MSIDGKQRIISSLIKYAPQLLPQTPCHFDLIIDFLMTERAVKNHHHAMQELIYLSETYPLIIITEKEGIVGHFLIFYYLEFLKILTGECIPNTLPLKHRKTLNSDEIFSELYSELKSKTRSHLTHVQETVRDLLCCRTELESVALKKIKQEYDSLELSAICKSDSLIRCQRNPISKCSRKIHIEKVISSHTDPSLGDCSYLDTCFKGRKCRFIHYRIHYPPNMPNMVTRKHGDTSPAQWIQADLMNFDLGNLGNHYSALIIDPPWDIHTNPNSKGFSDSDILNLNVQLLQNEGIAFLWVTGRSLDQGKKCLAKWGYENVQELIWLKTNQLGRTICTGRTGHWLNHTKEHVLVGTKGHLPPSYVRMIDTDVIVSSALGNGQKPIELYSMIDRLVGHSGHKLELFGRETNIRPGWLVVGMEVPGTYIVDPKLKSRTGLS